MKAYVILKKGEHREFETILFDADEVIEYINMHNDLGFVFEIETYEVPKQSDEHSPINIPLAPEPENPYISKGRYHYCKTWTDCTNPRRDCLDCPLMYNYSTTISTPGTYPNINEEPKVKPDNNTVLNDTVKVTYTGDCILDKNTITCAHVNSDFTSESSNKNIIS